MDRLFFVKKDPNTVGKNIEWVQMELDEFNQFRKSKEGKGRFFIELSDITIESTRDEYLAWKKENNHANYLMAQKVKRGCLTVSMEALYYEELLRGENVIPDDAIDMEAEIILKIDVERVRQCLQNLDSESAYIIYSLFLSGKRKSQRELAGELGLTQQAMSWRKKKILEKLKIAFVKTEKSQQINMSKQNRGDAHIDN